MLHFGMLKEIIADRDHYEAPLKWWQEEGFWVVATYRLGSWAHDIPFSPARFAVLAAYKAAVTPWRWFKNVSIPAKAKIGPGLCLHHPFNIIMPPGIEIGSNVTIYHEVTIGRGPIPGIPKIGNNVVIYAGAKVLGGITIGDNVEIGANAVVTRDIASGSTVAAPSMRPLPAAMKEAIRVEGFPSAPPVPKGLGAKEN